MRERTRAMEQVKTAQGRCHRCVHGRGPFREVEVVVAEVEEGEKAAPRLMACSTNGGMLQKGTRTKKCDLMSHFERLRSH